MSTTIAGRLTDQTGVSQHLDVTRAYAPGGQLIANAQRTYVSLPADRYRSRQPRTIPLDLHHDKICGEVTYLERNKDGISIVAVAFIDELADLDLEMFLSPALRYHVERHSGSVQEGTNVEIDSIALCTNPATVGNRAHPIVAIHGDMRQAHDYAKSTPQLRWVSNLIGRAREYERNRHRDDDHVIIDVDQGERYERAYPDKEPPGCGPMRYSAAVGQVLSVR